MNNTVTQRLRVGAVSMALSLGLGLGLGLGLALAWPASALAADTYLQQMNAKANKKASWFKKHYAPVGMDQVVAGKPIPEKIALYLAADVYLVNAPALNAYLNGLKDKLLAQWQGTAPTVVVLVESQGYPDLKADIHNQIIISTATLRTIKSEDQLAGMLAHELSHILLNHNHDKSVYAELVPGFLEASGLASLLYKSHEAEQDNKTLSEQRVYELMLSTNTASWVWSDLVSPAWDRNHERDADKMGLDLMISAGYNPQAYVYALQDLALITEKKTERLQYLKKVAVEETARRVPSARTDSEFDEVIAAFEFQMKSKAVEKTFDSMAVFSIEHDPADKREAAVNDYMGSTYTELGFPPPMQTEPYLKVINSAPVRDLIASDATAAKARREMMDNDVRAADQLSASALNYKSRNEVFVRVIRNEVRLAQAKPDKARQNLETALQQPLATKSVYGNLAKIYLLRHDPQAAEQVLLQASQRLGEQPGHYPMLVAAAKAQKDLPKAEQYTKACKGSQSLKDSIGGFFKKSRGLNVQQSLYEQCVAVLGYDPEKKDKKDKNKGKKEDDKPLDDVKDAVKSWFS